MNKPFSPDTLRAFYALQDHLRTQVAFEADLRKSDAPGSRLTLLGTITLTLVPPNIPDSGPDSDATI